MVCAVSSVSSTAQQDPQMIEGAMGRRLKLPLGVHVPTVDVYTFEIHSLKVPTHTIQGVLATIGIAYILGS